MKILVVSQFYWPEHFQVTDICESLVERGHSVTVLTGLPNYPSGVIYEGYQSGQNRHQIKNGVRIIRAPLIPRGKNPPQLALNYHSFAISAKRVVGRLDSDFDVVYVYGMSPVMMAEPALLYKKKYGTPVLFYCLDLWPESLKAVLGNHLSCIVKLYGGVSKRIYSAVDHIAVQSPAFIDYFSEYHRIPATKMSVLPQYADSDYLTQSFSKDHDGINFLITGNMGRAQDIPVVLRAVEEMRHRDGFAVHFVGGGSCFEDTRREIGERKLGNRVFLHGPKPYEEMPSYLSIADACVLTLDGSTWIGTTVPARLQGYMAAGKPVLAAINGGSKTVIEEARCGGVVRAGDSAGLAALMDDFIDHPEAYASCGSNSRSYFIAHFLKDKHLDSLESMLQELVGERI